jgi:cobalt-precorrin 5A hydrolase
MPIEADISIAVWALTPNGLDLAGRVLAHRPGSTLFHARHLTIPAHLSGARSFEGLCATVAAHFHTFDGHVFIMAAGIVVRAIAPLLRHKAVDPAVVVVDDRGGFAISLLSGHIGGANRLTRQVAGLLQAVPVITTATDVNGRPAIDLLAVDRGMAIENAGCIKAVNLALLSGEPVRLHDPDGWLEDGLPGAMPFSASAGSAAAVWVDDRVRDLEPQALVLRPPSLVAGIGCNRGTSAAEIRELLDRVLHEFALARGSLRSMASIDLKSDEPGLCALAAELGLPLYFFAKEELARVEAVPSPSATVRRHTGVPNVCEAAAILAGSHGRQYGQLIVSKQKNRNATVAIARRASMSSDWGRVIRPTCPGAPGKY